MSPRKEFLLALFRILDQKAVPYCVLRNYANIYENTSSDVDVAVEPEHVLRFKDCLTEAAAASNHHLVLRARYINYSYVYWHAEGGFVRVDIETEVRWHIFPVLTAKAIVGLRRRKGAFYIPHPRHESAILWSAAIWRGQLSDRYRSQLARLYEQATTPREFQRTFIASFGAIGRELAASGKSRGGRSSEMPSATGPAAARCSGISPGTCSASGNESGILGAFRSSMLPPPSRAGTSRISSNT
jgi:hypothetical protein